VFLFDNSDPEMQRAYENARATFRYFWREVAWERRRIVPALEMSCLKAPFSDGEQRSRTSETPEVEHMWLSEIDFDGRLVSGVLLNSPNWLKSVKEGDRVRVPPGQISDWMYVLKGDVYGAYTVNLLRSRMGRKELQQHDNAWGLNFGDPHKIRIRADREQQEVCEAMATSLKEHLAKNPSLVSAKSDEGWTLLHQEALSGIIPTVKVLLDAGADPNAGTNHGMTPVQLARSLGWDEVVALLASKGGK
jgi:uncharacterized protein YegJ (DUF2314 family)